ncbi:MAG: DUF1697 domain-containing protein [Armatimonadota bacterium]|nr:DUF1697 domain-containing protein [Armatimonadota bacterium]
MPVFIGLLRAVNVGGKNKVSMSQLREALARAGYSRVKTLLQSGNLLLVTTQRSGFNLAEELATIVERELGVKTEVIVRSPAQLRQIIDENPFDVEAGKEPSRVFVFFTRDAATAKDIERLRESRSGAEEIRSRGRQLYVYYPTGMGQSKLTGTVIERIVKTRATARNWNTVLKLADLAATALDEDA